MSGVARTARTSWTDVIAPRKATSLLGLVAEKTDDNRRWALRRESATAGYIVGGEIVDPVSCVILDTSSTGARIEVRAPRGSRFHDLKDLPKQFTMVFSVDRVALQCKIAWRRGSELGLTFTSPARTIPKPKRSLALKPKK